MAPVRRARADISAKTVVPNSASRRLRRGRALEVMRVILRRINGVLNSLSGHGVACHPLARAQRSVTATEVG